MPGPKATEIQLSEPIKKALERLEKGHTTEQQIAKRAKIIRLAAAGESNSAITKALKLPRQTVVQWRQRWLMLAEIPFTELSVKERLEDLPRSGRPPVITAEQRCQLEAIACQPPEQYGRPLSQWTARELADELVKQGIVKQLSQRHAGRLLKRSHNSSPSESILAQHAQR